MRRFLATWQQLVTGTWAPPPWARTDISDVPVLRFLARLVRAGFVAGTAAVVTLISWLGTGNGTCWQLSLWLQRVTYAILAVLWTVLITRMVRKYRRRRPGPRRSP